jgi:hypothetical protein
MPCKAAVLLVVSFLLVILIYNSAAKVEVFGLVKLTGSKATCVNQGLKYSITINGYAFVEKCCQVDNSGTGVFCQECYYADPNLAAATLVTCDAPYSVSRAVVNSTSLPNPLGNALAPPRNNTGTPPFGGIIKVPPGTIGSAINPAPTNNNIGNPITMKSSDNPPGCSKKVPIPPNCTLNPFNNSASNKGTASLGNIIKAPVNNTNALPTGNNTSTPPPALTLSQQSLAGQQPQTQQTTGHHHHKGSSIGASTSTGSNSTGH